LNFLQLCARTASECGVSTTEPSATTSQTGRLGQIVNWTNAAWMDLQQKRNDWRFMVGSFSVNTVADDGAYSLTDLGLTAAGFRAFRRETLKAYLTSAGSDTETDLVFMEYDDWYRQFNTGAQSSSYPRWFTVDHDNDLLLAPKPDAIYTVRGEYMKAATELSDDSDTPELGAEWHMAIVYRAMMKYGRYAGAPEVYADGEREYKRMLREMLRTLRLPDLKAGALA
jgi:hypothetical protein